MLILFYPLLILLLSCGIFLHKRKYGTLVAQKGILFLSHNNPFYIDSLKSTHDFNDLFINDIFIPFKNFDSSKSLSDNFSSNNLGEGVEVGLFEERVKFATLAERFRNDSIFSPCYKEKEYSIFPVSFTFKKLSASPDIYNCGNKVTLMTNGKIVAFFYKTHSIEIVAIEGLPYIPE